jgi:hypothetical protein
MVSGRIIPERSRSYRSTSPANEAHGKKRANIKIDLRDDQASPLLTISKSMSLSGQIVANFDTHGYISPSRPAVSQKCLADEGVC